jgi:hypothetical protein
MKKTVFSCAFKALAAVGLLGIVAIFGGCPADGETSETKCKCGPGTTHTDPNDCCHGVDCACIVQYTAYLGVTPILIEDRSGNKLAPKKLQAIEDALVLAESGFFGTERNTLMNTGFSTIIIETTGADKEFRADKQLHININYLILTDDTVIANQIGYTINAKATALEAAAMFNITEKSVRLASAPQKSVIFVIPAKMMSGTIPEVPYSPLVPSRLKIPVVINPAAAQNPRVVQEG